MAHLFVLTSRQYNTNELWPALKVFKKRGHTFDVVSTQKVITDEGGTRKNTVHKVLADIQTLDTYDAVVVISGNPKDTEFYWDDVHTQNLMQEASEKELVMAAICAAVPTIRIGLKGRKVSSYRLVSIEDLLRQAEALRVDISLMTDGNTVTAENEAMTIMWATNICDVVEKQKPTYVLHEANIFLEAKRYPPKVIQTLLEQKRSK